MSVFSKIANTSSNPNPILQTNPFGSMNPNKPTQKSFVLGDPSKNQSNQSQNAIHNRNKRNDPIHTVFFYNIPYTLPREDFISFAQQYGEISNQYLTIDKKGVAFITYFDIRNSERAVADAEGKELAGRAIGTNFAYTPPKTSRRDQFATCATIRVQTTKPIVVKESDLAEALRAFGEIRIIESNPPGWIVKFYNIRDAKRATEFSGRIPINGEFLNVELIEDDQKLNQPTQNLSNSNWPTPNTIYQHPPPVQPPPRENNNYLSKLQALMQNK